MKETRFNKNGEEKIKLKS